MSPKSVLGCKAVSTVAASYATSEWILILIHMPVLFVGSAACLALSCVIDAVVKGELKWIQNSGYFLAQMVNLLSILSTYSLNHILGCVI